MTVSGGRLVLARFTGIARAWQCVEFLGAGEASNGSVGWGTAFQGISVLSGDAALGVGVGRRLDFSELFGRTAGGGETPQIAAPTGETYSVAFQTELRSTSYPGVLRPAHFQDANENLLQMMESDPQFARQMQEAGLTCKGRRQGSLRAPHPLDGLGITLRSRA